LACTDAETQKKIYQVITMEALVQDSFERSGGAGRVGGSTAQWETEEDENEEEGFNRRGGDTLRRGRNGRQGSYMETGLKQHGTRRIMWPVISLS
jgi:hypothetical protein